MLIFVDTKFSASGREDVDVVMLGTGLLDNLRRLGVESNK